MKIEETIVGNIYYVKHGNSEYIFRQTDSLGFNQNLLTYSGSWDGETGNHSVDGRVNSLFRDSDYRDATPQEIKWYEACERAHKFVEKPKDEVVDSYIIY